MSNRLEEGQKIHLNPDGFDLTRVTIGLGWELPVPDPPKNFLEKLMGKPIPPAFDLDAIALLLDANGRIANLGHKHSLPDGHVQHMVDSDIIYFDNLHHPSGHIWHTGDSTKGQSSRDAEQIIVDLEKLHPQYHSLVFLVSIFNGEENQQHFGQVKNAYIRAVDAQGKEMVRYELSTNPIFNQMRAVTFAQAFRQGSHWAFQALGQCHPTGKLTDLLRGYVYY